MSGRKGKKLFKFIKRSLVFEGLSWKSVGEVSGSSNGFGPERRRGMGFKQKSSGNFEKSSILAFSNTILLRGIGACSLIDKAMRREKMLHIMINKFTTIIRMKNLNRSIKLSANHVIKFHKKS